LRNIGESSSLVKAAMSVLVARGGEAAAALWKLVEIWAGGRRQEERSREEAVGHSCPVSCTP
jgi:hypothetical protein